MAHLFEAEIAAARERQRLLLETLDREDVVALRDFLADRPKALPWRIENIPADTVAHLKKSDTALEAFLCESVKSDGETIFALHVYYMLACLELAVRRLEAVRSALEGRQSPLVKVHRLIQNDRTVNFVHGFFWPFGERFPDLSMTVDDEDV